MDWTTFNNARKCSMGGTTNKRPVPSVLDVDDVYINVIRRIGGGHGG